MDRRVAERLISHSPEETFALGLEWGKKLPANAIVCFRGELAAGKTTMIKGLVEGATGISGEQVQSPTFTYLSLYEAERPVYHFDLYRLSGVDAFLEMGFEEFFSAGGICCIEWSERITPLIPQGAWLFSLEHLEGDRREIKIEER